MKRQASAWVIIALLLAGCSASIPVRKLSGGAAPEAEGTLLVLPRTELLLKYNEVKTDFSPARWTSEVEECRSRFGITSESSRLHGSIPDASLSCLRLHDLGLYTKRPSLGKDALKCPSDTANSEKRAAIDMSSVALTASPVPDPDQVYWVETPARWLGDADVTLKYTSQGTVSGAKSVATNPWSNFAVDLAGFAIKGLVPLAGGSEANGQSAAGGLSRCVKLSDKASSDQSDAGDAEDAKSELTPCGEFHAELNELILAVGSRLDALKNFPGSETDKLLANLDADIDARRARFEGNIKKTATAHTMVWHPDPAAAVSAACAAEPSSTACLTSLVSPKETEAIAACPGTSNDPNNHVSPLYRIHVSAQVTEAGMRMRNTLAIPLNASTAGFDGGSKKDRGLPYRAPVATEVSTQLHVKANQAACFVRKGEETKASIPIAQFGTLGRLTPRAGGRKGTIDVVYFADTGALTSVQVAGEGSDAKPITDALQSRLTPASEPSELDILKAEKDRIEAMATICASYASLAAPAPDYCSE